MLIKSAEFVTSSAKLEDCPDSGLPEYAFIGRSNVGKSSLINMLTGRNKLAKISSKPGKTQLINHFLINQEWHLVDLPGYGWAQVSKTEKRKWKKMIGDYLMKRVHLFCVFLLIDSRHSPQPIDLEFMSWLGQHEIPFVLVFTKVDKLGRTQWQKNLSVYKKALARQWDELPSIFESSATRKEGRDELLSFIDQVNHTADS